MAQNASGAGRRGDRRGYGHRPAGGHPLRRGRPPCDHRRPAPRGAARHRRRSALPPRPDVTPVVCDLADPDDVEAALTRLPRRIDVLVNNAGSRELAIGAGPHGVLARWRGDFERNVLTAVLVTESLRDRFPEGGRVVTVTSVAALRGGGSYGASKAALHAWNHSLAAQLGPQRGDLQHRRPRHGGGHRVLRLPAQRRRADPQGRPDPGGPGRAARRCRRGGGLPRLARKRASSPARSCSATAASCSAAEPPGGGVRGAGGGPGVLTAPQPRPSGPRARGAAPRQDTDGLGAAAVVVPATATTAAATSGIAAAGTPGRGTRSPSSCTGGAHPARPPSRLTGRATRWPEAAEVAARRVRGGCEG